MHFAPDTEQSLIFLVDLANTDSGASRSGTDELDSVETLTGMLVGFSGRFDRDDAELADVVATRDHLRTVWSLDADDAVEAINEMLSNARALPQLVRHDDLDWHIHATADDAPLGERIRVESALALADIIRAGESSRLRICEADDCTGLLLDLSRNGSKRFCSVRCGNRMNMIAFRERNAIDA